MYFANTLDYGTAAVTNSSASNAESSDSSEDCKNNDCFFTQSQTTSLLPNQISGKNKALWERFSLRVNKNIRRTKFLLRLAVFQKQLQEIL